MKRWWADDAMSICIGMQAEHKCGPQEGGGRYGERSFGEPCGDLAGRTAPAGVRRALVAQWDLGHGGNEITK
jgi:hypothetical protein